MAGIYMHIPFCKTRCIYCDFYSTTRSDLQETFVEALCKELEMRRNYLKGEPVETIYLGGGTPSQLSPKDFEKIFATIQRVYGMEQCKEITLEANPDDLRPEYLQALSTLPFNRISMGIQTFDDTMLTLLKRRHSASQAMQAVADCRRYGFNNISIDLIYGLPGESLPRWEKDLEQAISLEVEHISAYHLTYEEGTPLHTMLQKHRVEEVDEESSVRFFSTLMDKLKEAGYEHYEISNFCRPNKYSRHNTSYWQGIQYLGCGPSAHSFDGISREWNVSSLKEYIESIEKGERKYETEERDLHTRYNEFVITSIRTRWGISLDRLQEEYGKELFDYCMNLALPYLDSGKLEIEEKALRLTSDGIFISDSIMSDLLRVDD